MDEKLDGVALHTPFVPGATQGTRLQLPNPSVGFVSGLRNFFTLYEPVVDSWQLFDNADLGGPRLIALKQPDMQAEVRDACAWQRLMEIQR